MQIKDIWMWAEPLHSFSATDWGSQKHFSHACLLCPKWKGFERGFVERTDEAIDFASILCDSFLRVCVCKIKTAFSNGLIDFVHLFVASDFFNSDFNLSPVWNAESIHYLVGTITLRIMRRKKIKLSIYHIGGHS